MEGTDAMAMRRVVRALRLEGEMVTVAATRPGSKHGQSGNRKDSVALPVRPEGYGTQMEAIEGGG